MTYVSRLTPSQHDANTVYAAFDNHKIGDFKPYVLKSTDRGRTWTSIAGDLPERGTRVRRGRGPHRSEPAVRRHGVRPLLHDERRPELDAAQAAGCRRSRCATWRSRSARTTSWSRTFGRGFYILDDLSPLRGLTPPVVAREATLFPVKRASMYVLSSPLGGTGASFQGASFFLTPNPAPGAVFTYHLNRELRSRRARRQAAERDAARRGQDVTYPPWDSLKVEDQEEAPAMILTVTDAEGRVVRRLTGPTTAGVQRVTWNLRYPTPNPVAAGAGAGGAGGGGGGGRERRARSGNAVRWWWSRGANGGAGALHRGARQARRMASSRR